AFGQTAGLTKKGVIQISPLAAAMPSEFNLSNLLSVTSPLITHVKAIAQDLDRQLREGDAVILYRTDESSSQQFLPALKTELRLLKSDRLIYEVENEEQLGERLLLNGE